jgi:hypothetical protein
MRNAAVAIDFTNFYSQIVNIFYLSSYASARLMVEVESWEFYPNSTVAHLHPATSLIRCDHVGPIVDNLNNTEKNEYSY